MTMQCLLSVIGSLMCDFVKISETSAVRIIQLVSSENQLVSSLRILLINLEIICLY